MEFLGYLGRYRLITASKIVLAYWTLFLLAGGLMTAADVPSLGAFDVVFASLAVVSLVLAIVILVLLVLYALSIPIALQGAPAAVQQNVKKSIVKTLVLGVTFPTLYFVLAIAALRRRRSSGR